MSILLDVLTVIIVVSSLWAGYSKGFVRSLIELAGFAASVIVAWMFSVPAGNWIYDHLLKNLVHSQITAWYAHATDSARQAFDRMFSQYHFGSGSGSPALDALTGVTGNAQAAAQSGADAVKTTLMHQADLLGGMIGRGVAFLLIFFACLALVHWIARAANILNRLPLIGSVNRLGGFAIGAVKAGIVMILFCTVVAILIPIFSVQKTPPLTNTSIDNTHLFQTAYRLNPAKGILLKN